MSSHLMMNSQTENARKKSEFGRETEHFHRFLFRRKNAERRCEAAFNQLQLHPEKETETLVWFKYPSDLWI